MTSTIVRTVRAISEDLDPSNLPDIPKGHYGIDHGDGHDEYRPVDFGAPWGW